MSGFLFKLIFGLVVIGLIFFGGFIAGGGFATEAAEDAQQQKIVSCLPINTTADLDACLGVGGDE